MVRAGDRREALTWRLPAAKGFRSWLADTVNVSELLINPVKMALPKLLIGNNQKVCGWITRW
jgi:hypothetical protein